MADKAELLLLLSTHLLWKSLLWLNQCHVFHILCFLLVTLLFKVSPKGRTEVLSSVSKYKKVEMCLKYFSNFIYFYLCVYVYIYVCMCITYMQCPQWPDEGMELPGTGVIGCCEMPNMGVWN